MENPKRALSELSFSASGFMKNLFYKNRIMTAIMRGIFVDPTMKNPPELVQPFLVAASSTYNNMQTKEQKIAFLSTIAPHFKERFVCSLFRCTPREVTAAKLHAAEEDLRNQQHAAPTRQSD